MIMLVTYRPEFREQLNQILQAKGHETCIPKHRQDVMIVIQDCHPHLIILDLYRSEPSGVDVLKTIRHHGYHGRVLVLSGQSMTSVLHTRTRLEWTRLCKSRRRSPDISTSGNWN